MFEGQEGETAVLREIRKLLPAIAAAAEETEANRSLPQDIVDRLGEAGIFRMMLPKSYGGEEMDLVQSMRVAEELAVADMSAGWTIMVTCGLNLSLGQFPMRTIDEVLANGPDVRMRGVTAPKGRLTEVEGGYRLSGQWAMASGSYAPDWVLGAAFIQDGDGLRMENGMPAWRIVIVRADKARFLDTWHTMGLCGTASHDFVLDDVFVPEHHVAPMFGPSSLSTPAYRVSGSIGNTAHHAGVRIGCARGALDELEALARVKESSFMPGRILAEDAGFRLAFGALVARLDATRSYAFTVMRELWERLCAEDGANGIDTARARSMLALVSSECAEIVTEAFRLGSSTSIYASSSLQRRMRDMQVAAQHAAASRAGYEGLGAAYLAERAIPPVAVSARAA